MKLEWKTCFKVGLSILLLYICIYYFPNVAKLISLFIGAATPLIIGGVIAYLVNILMSFYEKYFFQKSKNKLINKGRRSICMSGAYLTLLGIVALVIIMVVPQFIECVEVLFSQIPGLIESGVNSLSKLKFLPDNFIQSLKEINWEEKLTSLGSVFSSGIGNILGFLVDAVTSVFSGIITAFLGLIFSIYILASKEKLCKQSDRVLKHYLKPKWYEKLKHILEIMNNCFRSYIIGQSLEAVILGVLCTIGMLILGIPYAGMIGALVALTALIPIAGAYIGAVVGTLMILTISPVKAFIFIIFLIILQQLEENLIYPRVVGSSIGLPSIWVLAAITIGGGVLGIIGMIIGVPLAAVMYKLLREDLNKKKEIEQEIKKEDV